MKQVKICPHCSAKMVEYPHGLSKGLLRCLVKMVRAGTGDKDLGDLQMNYNQQSNFQKLRYWGLVEKSDPGSEKGGKWRMTDLGWAFVKGEIQMRNKVWSYRGEFVRFDGDRIFIQDVTGGWKYRPEYAREAVPHESGHQRKRL